MMRTPKRIQLRRTKGWRKPDGAIVVTRGTDWGNPFKIGAGLRYYEVLGDSEERRLDPGPVTRELAVALFRAWVVPRFVEQIRADLAGHDLACWCTLVDAEGNRVPCHADVLLEIANRS